MGAARRAVWVLGGWRRWVLTAVMLAGVATAALVAGAGASEDARNGNWWGPPRAVRAMLSQISPTNLRADDPSWSVSAPATRPLRRPIRFADRRGCGLDHRSAASDRRDVRREHDGPAADASCSRVSPQDPGADDDHQRHRDAAGDRHLRAARYVVGAHYDDRVTDVLDFTSDAPGADRDGSGVAAMLELARVFAAHPRQGDDSSSWPSTARSRGSSARVSAAAQLAAAGDERPGLLEPGHDR